MKKTSLFIIRGTGFSIDGTLVEKTNNVSGVDGQPLWAVRPYNSDIAAIGSVLIPEKYLQPIREEVPKLTYTLCIRKTNEDGSHINECIDVKDAIRDVNLKSLVQKFGDDLSIIVKG